MLSLTQSFHEDEITEATDDQEQAYPEKLWPGAGDRLGKFGAGCGPRDAAAGSAHLVGLRPHRTLAQWARGPYWVSEWRVALAARWNAARRGGRARNPPLLVRLDEQLACACRSATGG